MLTPELEAAANAGQVEPLKEAWREARVRVVAEAPPDDPGACRTRTALVDALVTALVEVCSAEDSTVVALGGYGRRELAPGSDLDLLIVRPESWDPQPVETILRRLWDAGIQVGHAVRTLEQVAASLHKDLASATGILEGRFVTGDPEGFSRLRREVDAFCAADRERFALAKLAEADERHTRRGAAVCLLAPDLKEGRGTLRDLQLARLLTTLTLYQPGDRASAARVLSGLEQADALLGSWLDLSDEAIAGLERAGSFLLTCRSALHELTGRAQDRLELHDQEELARRLGREERGGRLAIEVLMDEVYHAAQRVDRVLNRVRLRIAPPPTHFRSKALASGIAARGDEIVLDPLPEPTTPPADLAELLTAFFHLAQSTRRHPGPRTLDRLRLICDRRSAELRAQPPARQGLLELLAGTRGVASTLRAMHDCGYLGALLPEFAALECLAQADPYHVYSVDEHTLAALSALDGQQSTSAPEREELLREELLHRTARRDLLRLGILLHDAGKTGGSPGHTERGVALVSGVAERLDLEPWEARHVAFLVREHLTLSRLAEKRDVDAPETVAQVVDTVSGDPTRLDHLYLLTCADIRGVSPQAMSRWKDALLTRLYERASELIAGGSAQSPTPETVEGWVEALAGRADEDALRGHLVLCSRDYLSEVEQSEVLLHLELAADLADRPVALRCYQDVGCDRVWIATHDRPGLLADLCGTLAGLGLDILAASTLARDDGVVFDRFAVAAAEGSGQDERWSELESTISEVLSGATRPADLIAQRQRRQPPRPESKPPPVRIRLDNDVSPRFTLIDVSAPDRLGLLYELTRALASAGCDIRLAKIATKGNRAVDVFHVTTAMGSQLLGEQHEVVLRTLAQAARRP